MRIQANRGLDGLSAGLGLPDIDLIEAAKSQGIGIVGVDCQRQIELPRRLPVVAAPELAPAEREVRQMVDPAEHDGLLRKSKCLLVAALDRCAAPVPIEGHHVVAIGETRIGAGIAGIHRDGPFEEAPRLSESLCRMQVEAFLPLQPEVVGPHALGRLALCQGQLVALKPAGERPHNAPAQLILDLKDIAKLSVIVLGPEMDIGRRIDQLRRDPDSILRPAKAALDDVAYAQFASDAFGIDSLPAILERRVARDHEQRMKSRELSNDVLGHSIDEILELRRAAQVVERQHSNRRLAGRGESFVTLRTRGVVDRRPGATPRLGKEADGLPFRHHARRREDRLAPFGLPQSGPSVPSSQFFTDKQSVGIFPQLVELENAASRVARSIPLTRNRAQRHQATKGLHGKVAETLALHRYPFFESRGAKLQTLQKLADVKCLDPLQLFARAPSRGALEQEGIHLDHAEIAGQRIAVRYDHDAIGVAQRIPQCPQPARQAVPGLPQLSTLPQQRGDLIPQETTGRQAKVGQESPVLLSRQRDFRTTAVAQTKSAEELQPALHWMGLLLRHFPHLPGRPHFPPCYYCGSSSLTFLHPIMPQVNKTQ
jgi:hypothetical protein